MELNSDGKTLSIVTPDDLVNGVFTIPDSVTYVGPFTFAGCGDGCTEELLEVHLSTNVRFIEGRAFHRCNKLQHIVVDTEDEAEIERIKQALSDKNLRKKVKTVAQYRAQCDKNDLSSFLKVLPALASTFGWRKGFTISRALQREALLNQDNLNAFLLHQYPKAMATAIIVLAKSGLLNQITLSRVLCHEEPIAVAVFLDLMWDSDLLTENVLVELLLHQQPAAMAALIKALKDAHLLTEQNFNAYLQLQQNQELAVLSVINLARGHLLNQDNLDVLLSCHDKLSMDTVIRALFDAELLTQTHFNAAVARVDFDDLSFVLHYLSRTQLLNRDNYSAILLQDHMGAMMVALDRFYCSGVLTQQVLTQLLQAQHALLRTEFAMEHVWGALPDHIVTLDVFNHLCELARGEDSQSQLTDYVASLLAEQVNEVRINEQQSTHTASVHRSVSQSAAALHQHYGAQLSDASLDNVINEIESYFTDLSNASPPSQCLAVAARAFKRLTAKDYYFIDATSRISTQQLLALSWLAIHDDKQRMGELDDALAMFVEGLYEVQREYCLSEKGEDNQGDKDLTACCAGTFNKLVEKLVGVHPDGEIIFITPKTMSVKLKLVVASEAMDYLSRRANVTTSAGAKGFLQLIRKLKQSDDVAPIWPAIREAVVKVMYEEFACACEPDDEAFTALVDMGRYCTIKDYSPLQSVLTASKGYQAYQHQLLRANAFFARLNETTSYQNSAEINKMTPRSIQSLELRL